MKNRKLRKFLMLVSSALLLVCVTVGATVAYLTAESKQVVNTFSVGNVHFEEGIGNGLDEADVKLDGTYEKDVTQRVTENTYKLVPGHKYIKDPTVHIAANSENAYVFVKVVNPIAAIEADDIVKEDGTTTAVKIASQITANSWTALTGVEGVYYKNYTSQNTTKDEVVFNNFTISGTVTDDMLKTYADMKITINAYLVQKDGFETAAEAWNATFGATPVTPTEPEVEE